MRADVRPRHQLPRARCVSRLDRLGKCLDVALLKIGGECRPEREAGLTRDRQLRVGERERSSRRSGIPAQGLDACDRCQVARAARISSFARLRCWSRSRDCREAVGWDTDDLLQEPPASAKMG
jgi:hypothetical protein